MIIIGSGIAGFHAAIQAVKLKKRVCIIEKNLEKIGGSWIHTGTMPSKTLRETLAAIKGIESHVGRSWVHRIFEDLQTGKLFRRAVNVSTQEETLIKNYIERNQIRIARGYGIIEDRFSVRVISGHHQSYTLSTDYIVVATGSKPYRPEQIPFDGWRIVDSDDIFALENVPKTMVIYGAGVIGCEYACIFSALGVDVLLVDGRDSILQYCDREIVAELKKFMRELGVKFLLKHNLSAATVSGPKVELVIGEQTITTDLFFYAFGRVASTARIGLGRVNIKRRKHGYIEVNPSFQTSISNIYAVGDAVGNPSLAAAALQQGRYVSCHAFGANLGAFPKNFPVGIYTIPELSVVGKTEEKLKAEQRQYVVGRASYSEIARGYIRGDNHGLLKLLICKKTQKILGIHIVGEDASNLIHIGLAFMTKGGHAQDLINMVFNYPTLAEAYRIAAFNGLNKIFTDGVIKAPPLERRRNEIAAIQPRMEPRLLKELADTEVKKPFSRES